MEKKTYWVSYAMFNNKGQIGYGNGYFQSEDDFLYLPSFQDSLAKTMKAVKAIVLFYQERPTEEYDKAMAKDVSRLEAQNEQKKS